MSTERRVAPIAGFFKFKKKGQKIAGMVQRYKTGENGAFIVISPAVVFNEKGQKGEMWESVAIGLSTDLALKVTQRDVGRSLSLEFVDTEASRKGNPRKIFKVLQLEREELIELAQGSGNSHRKEHYPLAERGQRSEYDDEGEDYDASGAGEDDLPF